MTRRVLTNQNLSGQTLDASTQPDGHARESLLRGCTFDASTVFLGDIRGSEFINCTGPANWSQAQTHGCYWRGGDIQGAQFPADIGAHHYEVIREIIRQRAPLVINSVPANRRTAVLNALIELRNLLVNLDQMCWDTAADLMDSRVSKTIGRAFFRAVFQPYPRLLAAFNRMVRDRDTVGSGFTPKLQTTVSWDDGVSVTLDATTVPAGASAYDVARALETQARAQATGTLADYYNPVPPGLDYHVHVYVVRPPLLRAMVTADEWLTHIWGEY